MTYKTNKHLKKSLKTLNQVTNTNVVIKKVYLFMVELFWWIEHRNNEKIAIFGYRNRKNWEYKYIEKFNENIYGEKLLKMNH